MKLKTIVIRFAFVAAALVTLFAVIHVVEDYRGRRAWTAYEREARAKGVKLDLMEYVTPPIPDAENYAAIPLFQDTFSAGDGATPAPNPLAFPKPDVVS